MWRKRVSGFLEKAAAALESERGTSTPEWLVLAAGAALLAVLVSQAVLPALRNAHNTAVNRVTGLTGSGF